MYLYKDAQNNVHTRIIDESGTTQTVEDGLPTLAKLYEREAKEIVYKIKAYSFLK